MDDVTSKLVEILREHLQFVGADEELQMTQELSELGLDSAGAIGLLGRRHAWSSLRRPPALRIRANPG